MRGILAQAEPTWEPHKDKNKIMITDKMLLPREI